MNRVELDRQHLADVDLVIAVGGDGTCLSAAHFLDHVSHLCCITFCVGYTLHSRIILTIIILIFRTLFVPGDYSAVRD